MGILQLFREIYLRRDLVRELVIKDLKLRYGRPGLGILWAFLSPLLMVVVFYIVFSLIFEVSVEEAPFFLYLMSAILPWSFFQSSLMGSATSLMDNKNLIREANVVHYLIPLSLTLANLINFLPSFAILVIATLFISKGVSILILFLPVVLLIHAITTFGLGMIFSVLYVRWRDVRYILESVLLFLFYLTPVFYSVSLVESKFPRILYKIYIFNPFMEITNLYRVVLFKGFYSKIVPMVGVMNLLVVPVIFSFMFLWLSLYIYKFNKNSINDRLSY